MKYADFITESAEYLTGTLNQRAQIFRTALLSVMDEFHRVCVKNNITYFMGFGTLLGAKRDGGLIPWDFDIDLLVKYEDKFALIEALKKDLSDDFYFKCLEVDKKYGHFDMRICKKGVHDQILHVDIFYLLDAPDNKEAFKKHGKKLIKLAGIRRKKFAEHALNFNSGKISRTLKKLYSALYSVVPVSYLNNRHKKLCKKYSNKNTHTYFRTCLSPRNLKFPYPKEWFNSAELIPFDGREYYAPKKADEILTLFYKDYKKYPSTDERFFDFLSRVKLADEYSKNGLSNLW